MRWLPIGAAIVLLLALTAARLGGQEGSPAPLRGAREYPGLLPGLPDLERGTASIRVLGDSGEGPLPIEGARVTVWSEETSPMILSAQLLADDRSDTLGIANLTWHAGVPHHWVIEAEGWGTWRSSHAQVEVVLAPGVVRRLRILDPLGAPLADAEVQVFHGCRHSPALRVGKTDSVGHVSFRDLPADPHGLQIRIDAPGVRPLGPYFFPTAMVGDKGHPPTLVARPGRSVSGRVLAVDGAGIAGVIVREAGNWRGPSSVTDEKGRFRLHGLGEEGSVTFHRQSAPFGERPSAIVAAYSDDVPLRVVLLDGRPNDIASGEVRYTLDIEACRRWSGQGESTPADGVPVHIVRLSDGYTVTGLTGSASPGLFAALVPPGTHRISVGGGFSEVQLVVVRAQVSGSDVKPIRLTLDGQPELECYPWDKSFRLQIQGAETRKPGPMPPARPAVLVLDRPPFVVPIGPTEGGVRSASIPPMRTVRCLLRVAPEGEGVRREDIRVLLDGGDVTNLVTDGVWAFESSCAGIRHLVIAAPGHQSELREIAIPGSPCELDLGTIALHESEERVYRVVDSKGRPLDGSVSRVGRTSPDEWPTEFELENGAFGTSVGPRPDTWLFSGEGWFPTRFDTSLATRPEIRLPRGRLTLLVKDAKGRGLSATAYVGPVRLSSGDGTLDLRGVPDGEYTVLVGAQRHIGQVGQVVIRGGTHLSLDVTLASRP
jgi:hypothetical protein